MVHRTQLTVAALVAALLTPASVAAATSPAQTEYGAPVVLPVAGESAGPVAPAAPTPTPTPAAVAVTVAAPDDADAGALPFTGAELALLGLAGAGIAMSGAALRMVGRKREKPDSKTPTRDA